MAICEISGKGKMYVSTAALRTLKKKGLIK